MHGPWLFSCLALSSIALMYEIHYNGALNLSPRDLLRRQYDWYEVKLDPEKTDLQFFTFVTRPDITAPRWDLKIHRNDAVSPGYWFVAPYLLVEDYTEGDRAYIGPHIYDNNGELIWSGAPNLVGHPGFDFKVSRVGNKEMLTMISLLEHGAIILDDSYEIYGTIYTGITGDISESTNIHDFQITDNGTRALFIISQRKEISIPDPQPTNSFPADLDGKCNVLLTGFGERDLESNDVVFNWSPENRINLTETTVKDHLDGDCKDIPWDYLHANSIEKLPDGDYLVSAHRTYAIYKISHEDGSIIWRLGGKQSDFQWIGNDLFAGQHDARCLEQNSTHMLISILDNANGPGEPRISNDYSRGLIISLRTDAIPMTAQIVSAYDHPDKGYAPARGNLQILPNGNALVGWSIDALFSEHTSNGDLIMEARLPSQLKTYRNFKFQWTGHPKSPPDVHSTVVEIGARRTLMTVVHVSWNGATEVAVWNLHKVYGNGSHDLVASSRRRGFETALTFHGYAGQVLVEAVALNGTIIGSSAVLSENKSIEALHPAVVVELQDSGNVMEMNGSADGSQSSTVILLGVAIPSVLARSAIVFGGGLIICLLVYSIVWALTRIWTCRPSCLRSRPLYHKLSSLEDAE